MGSEDRSHSEKELRPKVRLSPEDMIQLRRRLEQLGQRLNRTQPLADLRVSTHIVRNYRKESKKG
jgi:tetrahydromethanopterin S-methyltransferase subunit G